MQYKWRFEENTFPVDPQTIGETLEELNSASGGKTRPQQIVDASRPPDAPLHKCFTWKDSKAAELWRCREAERLSVSVTAVNLTKRQVKAVDLPPVKVLKAEPPAYATLQDAEGVYIAPTIKNRTELIRETVNSALDKLVAAREKLEPYRELRRFGADIQGYEAETKAIRAAIAKLCSEIEQTENGLVETLMPPKHQPQRDERRLASV
jgi:hypothetical protein